MMLSLRTFKVPNSNSEGAALDLWKFQVIDLVPYISEAPGFDDEGEVIGNDTQDDSDDEDFDGEFEDSGSVVEEEEVDEEFDEEF